MTGVYMEVEVVEVCYLHRKVRRLNENWVTPSEQIEVTDEFDNADFVESTCPDCSSQ